MESRKQSINPLSLISIPIELTSNNQVLGPATGFFYVAANRMYFISNWHVFSGRNSQTGQPLHSSGATPTHINLKMHTVKLGITIELTDLPLVDANEKPLWLQHANGQEIDLACIAIDAINPLARCYFINEIPQHDLKLAVHQEVAIIGFPRGFCAQGIFPIWKRGTIAAEPDIAREDNLPIYLVDTATREGMSGSPVYLIARGVAAEENGTMSLLTGDAIRFLGVYSGRYGSESDMQLGRVWSTGALEQLLNDPKPGSYELRKS